MSDRSNEIPRCPASGTRDEHFNGSTCPMCDARVTLNGLGTIEVHAPGKAGHKPSRRVKIQ